MKHNHPLTGLEIAIVGMACRFPGASDWREYWRNLVAGKESVYFLSDEELASMGVDKEVTERKDFVRAVSYLKDKDHFDAGFFNYTPDEAKFLSPQIKVFHECVWQALEDAGFNPDKNTVPVSLYAGTRDDLNWTIYSMLGNTAQEVDEFTLSHLNNKDYLTSLLAYKLNLRGPSFALHTACSTSLVAIHEACKSLLLSETKIAVAGGVNIVTQQQAGYFFQEGMINAADGHCRTFDKDATGTVLGEGAGAVVLKRLADAINDGDHIYAVIKGSAVNTDGARKIGFTAPSVEGQAECIRKALRFSKVEPETISYVEAHGTATPLGDPIEIAALNIAFSKAISHRCAIGSVKTNMGHLDTAAGIAGLIKTALSLRFRKIPASLHYNEPNPEIDFASGPFYVNAQLADWTPQGDTPLRAGVSSFGIGGVNAHVILEEAPPQTPVADEAQSSPAINILTLSAKTKNSLDRYTESLKRFIQQDPAVNPTDIAYTLQTSRKHFEYRRAIAFTHPETLMDTLQTDEVSPVVRRLDGTPDVIFMFPGQGSQYVNMCRELYLNEPAFRATMDNGFGLFRRVTGEDLKAILYPEGADTGVINEAAYAQSIIFLIEYALAALLMSYGIKPQGMIGHSVGEYTAACLSGVLDFETTLTLLIKRGKLMQQTLAGSMFSVSLTPAAAAGYLTVRIALAAVNSPDQVVLSGEQAAMAELAIQLDTAGISYTKLHTSHAFHSPMLDPMLDDFRQEVARLESGAATIPYISNLTGMMMRDSDISEGDYWVKHMRDTVQFSAGITVLREQFRNPVFIEVGAGHALINLVRQHPQNNQAPVAVNLVRSVKESVADDWYFTTRIGQLWALGVPVDWNRFYPGGKGKKISLPPYTFEPIRYPAEVNAWKMLTDSGMLTGAESRQVNDWFHRVQWKQGCRLPGQKKDFSAQPILLFAAPGDEGITASLYQQLTAVAATVTLINNGDYYTQQGDGYLKKPGDESDMNALFADLKRRGIRPAGIIHCGACTAAGADVYKELLHIARSYVQYFPEDNLHIDVIGKYWYNISGNETIVPLNALVLGAVKVIPLEFEQITCRAVEIDAADNTVQALMQELHTLPEDQEVALRGRNRYIKGFEKINFQLPAASPDIRVNGTYLITGSGGMGRLFAHYLATEYKASLILVSRGAEDTAFAEQIREKGGKWIYIRTDFTDETLLAEGIRQAESILGPVNGVLHTAGIGDYAGMIFRRSDADDEKIFAAKVGGTQLLSRIFREKELDFFVNCSSLAASFAHIGQVGYVAANIFLDTFAECGQPSYPVISIEWGALKEVGMAVDATRHLNQEEQREQLKYSCTPAEAIRALTGALYLKLPVQLIATRSIKALSERHLRRPDNHQGHTEEKLLQERPALSTAYIAPETATEHQLSELIQLALGISRVGVIDKFFELGGDSLKGMTLLKKIKQEMNIEFPVRLFFEKQTIRQLAAAIDDIRFVLEKKERTSKITI
ncbi:type I polyketide synthase [Chitinophaga nivalis]|uniref:SDR family NAD(P)-dependent oxidoreductase n=2 Tax=Chitinophaga nivalis TaxID=2991709 RepID=A0ABT3IKB5_9BACT|nr:type I polyketide synthase [Chitinophaga nivalis]MCW3465925.1 SDR family NAD(P)-dependent oxidoreductase [Chitinophaga nivalis]MCW3484384.1 SDR family NAD(P)-dependent oxidoreductase [Chitinophaga nivalis]